MPFVNIRIVREAIASDPRARRRPSRRRSQAHSARSRAIGKSDIWVVFEEVAARDWYLGPTSVETLRGRAGKGEASPMTTRRRQRCIRGPDRSRRAGRADRDRVQVHRGPHLASARAISAVLRHAGRRAAAMGPGGGVEEVRRPANKCNGMTYDADLNLIVCEHATSSLVRERADGRRKMLASHFEGKELNSPNDVCVRSDGSINFTDPWYGRMPGFGVERPHELGFQGVYRVTPDGALCAARRARSVRAAERPVLLARREEALCQRLRKGADPRFRSAPTARFGRGGLRLRHPLGDGARRPGRNEMRRAQAMSG